jgi:hypothetical protein
MPELNNQSPEEIVTRVSLRSVPDSLLGGRQSAGVAHQWRGAPSSATSKIEVAADLVDQCCQNRHRMAAGVRLDLPRLEPTPVELVEVCSHHDDRELEVDVCACEACQLAEPQAADCRTSREGQEAATSHRRLRRRVPQGMATDLGCPRHRAGGFVSLSDAEAWRRRGSIRWSPR